MSETEAVTLLKSRKLEDRLRGLRRLDRLPDETRWRLALPILADKSHFVATEAIVCLMDCSDWEVLRVLLRHFDRWMVEGAKGDPGCHLRAKLAYLFGHQEYIPASDALKIGIRTVQIEPVGGVPFDTGAHLRANCALALASLRAPDALRDISLLLFGSGGFVGSQGFAFGDDPHHLGVEPRKAAAVALGLLGDPAGTVPLTIKLNAPGNEAGEVLQECMAALVALRDSRATEFLAPFLQHRDEGLAGYAALMIARSENPDAATVLGEALPGLRGEALNIAALALVTMRTEASETILRTQERDGSNFVCKAIREARMQISLL